MATQLTMDLFKEKISDLDEDFNFKGDKPAVIDFYADWCGPCKMVAPVIEELTEEFKGRIDIYKVNTDQESELATAFQIQSIPSILFIPLEGEQQMAMGAIPKDGFLKAFKDIFGIE